jgi:hypothetical protein
VGRMPALGVLIKPRLVEQLATEICGQNCSLMIRERDTAPYRACSLSARSLFGKTVGLA